MDTRRSIDEIFRNAQQAFNTWNKLDVDRRTTETLLSMLNFDFFKVLDSVTIARSRKHIEKYYSTAEIGKFPERLKPISKRPNLTDLKDTINYNQIYELLMTLNLTIYTPSNYIMPSRISKYIEITHHKGTSLTQQGREEGIRRLMSINLLKRLESSVYSFRLTVDRIKNLIDETIQKIYAYKLNKQTVDLVNTVDVSEFDEDDQNVDFFSVGKKVKIDLADMDYLTWLYELEQDAENLELLSLMIADITPDHDKKLQILFMLIKEKMQNPINDGNKKIIIFTAFSDTADYLYENVSKFVKDEFGLDTAKITGSVEGKTTIPKLKSDLNTVLTCFSPFSKGKTLLMPDNKEEIDVLIATDCISEGQNLQDCDYLVNYDIKKYDAAGQAQNGIFADIFEEEYKDIFANMQLTMGDDEYLHYLKMIPVSSTHAGYFSIDKKGHFINSKLSDKKEKVSDDIDAYDLIMKNKELLLDRDPKKSPVRFIFSHSVLREGWDNPNVFQICTLKQSNSEIRKRQEIGRGLRLCVNQYGERMDVAVFGKDVHNINILTVIASESYDSFVKELQLEMAEAVADRPCVVSEELFHGKVIKNDNGNKIMIDLDMARAIHTDLILNGYIDRKYTLTDKYYEEKANNDIKIAEEIVGYKQAIITILDSIYDPKAMQPENARSNNIELTVRKDKLEMPEFKSL